MRNAAGRQSFRHLHGIGRPMLGILRLLRQTDARLSVWLLVLQCGGTLLPLAQLWVAKLIIDRLVAALRLADPSRAAGPILWLVVLEFGLAAIALLLREGVNYARQVLAERLTGHVSLSILAHAQQLDLPMLERPDYYDRLRRAEEGAFYRPAGLLFQLLAVLQGSVTLLAAAIILARLQPLALPLLVLAAIPYALVQSGAAAQAYTLSMGQTPEARQARYFSQLLSTDAGAKEIRVFALGPYLLERYREILQRNARQIARLARRRGIRSAATALLPAAVYSAIFAYLSVQALGRHITVGDLTLYIGLVFRSQDALQQLMLNLSSVLENGLFVRDYEEFLRLQPAVPAPAEAAPVPHPITAGISFEHVSYRYPQSERAALDDITLELRAGQTTALVGENGAGKTTLVKLLAHLYDPHAGTITVDGRDLRTLDVESWRRQIAVIFQDFLQYYLSAAENIGFGQVDRLDDRPRVEAAAARGGADEVIARLPLGYHTTLGRWFEEGTQLSGGEWQRIALARAFMRDSPILVLDEPTASLDARAEAELFRRFAALTRDRIVLLISHRFSTVRMADRIYVLDGGRIVESGAHHDLMRQGGRYAELFELQAAGYQP